MLLESPGLLGASVCSQAQAGVDRETEANPVFKEPFSDLRWSFRREAVWRPPTDVYETDDSAVVIVEIPGLQEGDFDIALSGRTLLISGERRDPAEKLTYQQMEIHYGRFRTQVYLPWALDSQRVEATYEGGFLRLGLRKAQAKHIPVEVVQDSKE
jgi:HSP20 family protein